MDFFNKLTKKAKETYEGASKKTGELAKEAKLKMKMNENKSEINDLYQEIGKKVYEKHVLSEEINIKIDLEDECTKIDILSAEIETCLNQIRKLKDKKQCPKCFNEIELSAKFCNNCGAKQQEEEVREIEVVSTNNMQDHHQEDTENAENSNSEVSNKNASNSEQEEINIVEVESNEEQQDGTEDTSSNQN